MKKHIELIISIVLIAFTLYFVLDTLVIEKTYQKVEDTSSNINSKSTNKASDEVVSNDSTYSDDNMTITLKEYYENDTKIYVADVWINDSSLLRTAFAKSSYGKNLTEKTSVVAERVNAILAINGDYYGVQEKGYVLKNGVIYRNTAVNNKEDLVIYENGSFEIINESDISLEELLSKGAYNVLSFGPALVENSAVSVTKNQEVGKAMVSNPRTSIGIISKNHYVFVVSDGRTSDSVGLSLYELAEFMKELGCTIAYNLDGGGSSTMYFNGNLVNNPTTNGNRISERSISDIVYVGY